MKVLNLFLILIIGSAFWSFTSPQESNTEEVELNSLIMFEHKHFNPNGDGRKIIVDVTKYQPQLINSLHVPDFKDCLSSIKWNLEDGVRVTIFEHHKNGGGKSMILHGKGQYTNTHDKGLGDNASSWAWHRVR